jgi:hypothetical protein
MALHLQLKLPSTFIGLSLAIVCSVLSIIKARTGFIDKRSSEGVYKNVDREQICKLVTLKFPGPEDIFDPPNFSLNLNHVIL